MEFEVKEPICLAEGKHEGEITKIEYREEPYRYTDIYIKEKESGIELKYGCPTTGSINGKLMRTISKFQDVKAGMKVDPEKILIGKEVVFMTINEDTKEGTFIRIVENSLKPKTSEEKVE